MELPNVKHDAIDEANNVTYHVMAYRQLTQEEVLATIRYYRSTRRRGRKKKPDRNMEITIQYLGD